MYMHMYIVHVCTPYPSAAPQSPGCPCSRWSRELLTIPECYSRTQKTFQTTPGGTQIDIGKHTCICTCVYAHITCVCVHGVKHKVLYACTLYMFIAQCATVLILKLKQLQYFKKRLANGICYAQSSNLDYPRISLRKIWLRTMFPCAKSGFEKAAIQPCANIVSIYMYMYIHVTTCTCAHTHVAVALLGWPTLTTERSQYP